MDQETMVQEKKVKDFHAYSRILMTFACFLLIGTFIPDNVSAEKEPLAFAIIGGLSLLSLTFHFGAERERKKGEQ